MFNQYKEIFYPFTIDGKTIYKSIRDISTNVRVRKDILDQITLFETYTLVDGDTPDIVAFKQYGDPKLHYLVILANETFDWRNDFPMSQVELDQYMKEHYVDPNGIHHYEDTNGNIVCKPNEEDELTVIPITNYEYEERINESKREIKLISKNMANSVVEAIKDIVA